MFPELQFKGQADRPCSGQTLEEGWASCLIE